MDEHLPSRDFVDNPVRLEMNLSVTPHTDAFQFRRAVAPPGHFGQALTGLQMPS